MEFQWRSEVKETWFWTYCNKFTKAAASAEVLVLVRTWNNTVLADAQIIPLLSYSTATKELHIREDEVSGMSRTKEKM